MTSPVPSLALGHSHYRAKQFQQAEQVYRQLLERQSADAELLFFLGSVCLAQNKLDDAIPFLRETVRIHADNPAALQNLGVALATQGNNAEAIESFREAIRLRPTWLEPLLDLGRLCQQTSRLDEAIHCFRQALTIQDNAELHNQLGTVLAVRGELHEALTHFSEALRQEPRYAVAHSNLLLALSHDPDQVPATLLAEHRWWDRLQGQGLAQVPTFPHSRDPERRLRIGYVSPDFRRCVVAPFIEPILANHDLAQVDLYAYAELPRPDETTRRLQALVPNWRSTTGRTHVQVAEQIRADGIDILIDLAGHTANNRLGVFARKPAPVQVTYLGYPGTTGLAAMDYRLTDASADLEGEPGIHTETLVRLPGCFCCYAPPSDAPAVASTPAEGRPIVFGSPHKLLKLNDPTIELWAQVLRAVPNSRLCVCRDTLTGETASFWKSRFEAKGIGSDQLDFRQAIKTSGGYLATYQELDVLLDAIPWSSHATACEALWMGVPVLTLTGNRCAGRMAASILTAVGLPDLIATTSEDYVAIAVRLANDPAERSRLRATLRERVRQSSLVDARQFTRNLEDSYRTMWQAWCTS